MKGIEAVSHVYAEALLALAFEKGVPAEILRDLEEVGRILQSQPHALTFLVAPNIRKEAKRQAIDHAFGGRVNEVVQNFLKVAVDRGRGAEIQNIVQEFVKGYHDRQGELVAQVRSAFPLEDDARERLKGVLKAHFKHDGVTDVLLVERVDPSLLGGIIVRTSDVIYDGSLRQRLETMHHRLDQTRVKDIGIYDD